MTNGILDAKANNIKLVSDWKKEKNREKEIQNKTQKETKSTPRNLRKTSPALACLEDKMSDQSSHNVLFWCR